MDRLDESRRRRAVIRDMKTIDIVVPVYNEEQAVAEFNHALFEVLRRLDHRYQFRVIYVLDRSEDRSADVLKDIASRYPNVAVLHLSRRFGHQMSLVAGIDHSRGDAVIMMDSDLQHPPALIPALLEKFEEGYDVVHTIRKYEAGVGNPRQWSSRLFYALQNALSPIAIQSGAADFRLISRKVAFVFQNSIREQSQFLRGLFHWVGFRSASIDFISPPRVAGTTKYSVRRLLSFSILGILSFSKVPLRIATALGFTISAVCLIYSVEIVVIYFTSGNFPRGFASLFVGLLFIGGLQLVVLGIIGEYLGSIFDEVKHRPLYIVDEVVQPEAFPAAVSPY
jgi:dolichol-phosphate mannosyltransferase